MSQSTDNLAKPWTLRGTQLELRVQVQPGAKSTELLGVYNGRLKIRLQAPPVEGKANQALVTYLSQKFKIPKSTVSITKGANSRLKTLTIDDPQFLPAEFLTSES